MPLDNVQFEVFNLIQGWDKHSHEAVQYRKDGLSVDTLSLSRTPKNVGNSSVQMLWYTTN